MSGDFAAIITRTVADGRALAESLMTANGTARRPTGTFTPDPATDADVPQFNDLFTSACKVQARNLQAREQQIGGRTATTITLELHLPVSTERLTTGDVFEVTYSANDDQLVGRQFVVSAPAAKEYATARRYEVSEVVA